MSDEARELQEIVLDQRFQTQEDAVAYAGAEAQNMEQRQGYEIVEFGGRPTEGHPEIFEAYIVYRIRVREEGRPWWHYAIAAGAVGIGAYVLVTIGIGIYHMKK